MIPLFALIEAIEYCPKNSPIKNNVAPSCAVLESMRRNYANGTARCFWDFSNPLIFPQSRRRTPAGFENWKKTQRKENALAEAAAILIQK
jgi:hypothetical protein